MDDELLTRREMAEMALRAAALPGAALFLAAWLRADDVHDHGSATPAPPQPQWLSDYQPKFFAAEDFRALESLTELLIPTDETPGAREAYCARYIDFLLQASDGVPQTQQSWRRAIEAFRATGFFTAGATRRLELLTEIDRNAHHPGVRGLSADQAATPFAFYTSRAGMIENLDYSGNSYNADFPGLHASRAPLVYKRG